MTSRFERTSQASDLDAATTIALMAARRREELRESISRLAGSHPDDCPCTVCRAARGDDDALTEIYEMTI